MPAGVQTMKGPGVIDIEQWARLVYMAYGSIVLLFFSIVLGFILLLLLIALIRMYFHSRATQASEQETRRKKFQPDGQPYPPTGRGMCDSCQKAFEKVYYLPTGKRLCHACYESSRLPATDNCSDNVKVSSK